MKTNRRQSATALAPLQAISQALLLAAAAAYAIGTSVSEADVFEWWDDGIISQDEAEDILELLEEGNEEEACALAEIYAQEPCQGESEEATITARKKKHPPLTPHGYAQWKARVDTTGHIVSHREQLQISFYYYTLRLGSQELLTYKAGNYEAHFGDISTKELHSQIPLDTLWGAAAFYPIGNFYIGGLLDTSITTQVQAGYTRKQFSLAAMYWDAEGEHSGLLQAHLGGLSLALWEPLPQKKQTKQSAPLVKAKFQYRETEKQAREFGRSYRLSWNTTAYIHGSEIPAHARLSSSVLKNRLWVSQNITATIPQITHTKISGNANVSAPIDADTLKARFKITAESGPQEFHATLSATCLDASTRCEEGDWSIRSSSQFGYSEAILLDAQAKIRHNRHKSTFAGFKAPHIEAGISYLEAPRSKFRVAVILPKGTPSEAITLRNESEIGSDFLECILVVDFKQDKKRQMHPEKANFSIKVMF